MFPARQLKKAHQINQQTKTMPERFEQLIIGSAHEGAEGMFVEDTSETGLSPTALAEARLERGIFPDAQTRLEATLKKAELTQVTELENNEKYPTLDRWVEHRINYRRGTKFYPTFARNAAGELVFCKVQISENPAALQGLENEAQRLNNLPVEINAPRLIDYLPPTDGEAAMLVTEAIPWSAGSVAKAEKWTGLHAKNAAQQIRVLEESKLTTDATVEQTNYIEKAEFLLSGAGDTVETSLKPKIEAILKQSGSVIKPVTVHGDACLKNIIVGRDDTSPVMFVDWELGETGFLGQDAAKLWSDLSQNPAAAGAFLEAYLRDKDGTINQPRKTAVLFGVIVENLVHLKWRNEAIIQKGRRQEFPNLDNEIAEFNKRIANIFSALENHL